MGAWDHVVDAAQDFAFLKATASSDEERQARNLRLRTVGVAWIPGLLLTMLLAARTQNFLVALAGVVVLAVASWAYVRRPGFLRKGQ